jgi:catechol 2,3-dioxygenase
MAAIDPSLRVASVQLAVADLARSADFYERVLGLPLISQEVESARLGPDPEQPALVLEKIEHPTLLSPASTGLFHVAWLHPSRTALAASVRRVVGQRWPFDGASDHGVSEALYLTDPDGLGIELYADRPREQWEGQPAGRACAWSRCRSTSRTCWIRTLAARRTRCPRAPPWATCT